LDVKTVFGDVDAVGLGYHPGLFPGYPFRPQGKERGDPTLARPVKRPAPSRSIPRR
jgi:hypothetical protein